MPCSAGLVFPWIERVKRRSCARPDRGTSPAAPCAAFRPTRLCSCYTPDTPPPWCIVFACGLLDFYYNSPYSEKEFCHFLNVCSLLAFCNTICNIICNTRRGVTIGHTSSSFNHSINSTRGSFPVSRASFFGLPPTCLRLLQPPLEILCGDDTLVAFLFLRSGLLAPRIKLTVADAPGLDPRKAALILPAVDLAYRVVRLLQRPLLECTHRTAAGRTVEWCAVVISYPLTSCTTVSQYFPNIFEIPSAARHKSSKACFLSVGNSSSRKTQFNRHFNYDTVCGNIQDDKN